MNGRPRGTRAPSRLARGALCLLLSAAALCAACAPTGQAPAPLPAGAPAPAEPAAPAPPPAPPTPLADAYREAAARILAESAANDRAYARLAYLCDHIGARLAGSKALDEAVAWAAKTLRQDGQENVRTEKVMVPHWVRGDESAQLYTPVRRELHLLALGGSPPTPGNGVTAEVVVVGSNEELAALDPARVKGKIVLINMAMAPPDQPGSHYGEVSEIRGKGPVIARQKGAAAALIRSLTARSLTTPHTGGSYYDTKSGEPRIPAAALATEDADLVARLAAEGPVLMRLVLRSKTFADAASANVLAELRGRQQPQEIVLLGAHLDSWDVGQGAVDDGVGCVTAMEALALLRRLGLVPRRTIRVVLFTNEENGLRGAEAYRVDHAAEFPLHVAAIEADAAGFRPLGFSLAGPEGEGGKTLEQLTDIVTLLEPLDAARARMGSGGADIEHAFEKSAVPLLEDWAEGGGYFDIHHSEADTFDKVDPEVLRATLGAVAVAAYVIADMPGRLGT
jgi:carboxypeptidase Q